MNRILFILLMFSAPQVFAATLAQNTIPYVCQGGTTPQLCNSNITTDNNGKLNMFGSWIGISFNTTYQALSDGFLVGYWEGSGGGSYSAIDCVTDSSPSPTTVRSYNDINMGEDKGYEIVNCMTPVRKNDFYVISGGGDQPSHSGSAYFIPFGS